MTATIDNQPALNGEPPHLSWNLAPSDFEQLEFDCLQVLGAAVLSRWFELPRDVQEDLFTAATSERQIATDDLKAILAHFLHHHARQD